MNDQHHPSTSQGVSAVTTVESAGTPPVPSPSTTAELEAIKERQRTTWSSGDYVTIGTRLQIVGESLCEAVDVRAGWKVLDVAAGNGNCSLAAARRWCEVTATDYVPALLEDARRRAEADRLPMRFQEADVEALPFDDGAFDAVLSSYGVMFTPNPVRAAREIARVCRPGGRIGLASWTPRGFVGQLFGVIGRHAPPPAALTPPSRWGQREYLESLFGPFASAIHTTSRDYVFRYQSDDHWIDVFRRWYGPVHKVFAALPADAGRALERDLRQLLAEFNTSGDSTLVVPAEYLEAVIVRK